jgi:hypothetical protein
MQLQHHVHALAADMWPRCSQVEVDDGKIFCKIAGARTYDLVRSYAKTPHITFMNCDKDVDFKKFVSAWGPLLLFPEDLVRGWALVPLKELPVEDYIPGRQSVIDGSIRPKKTSIALRPTDCATQRLKAGLDLEYLLSCFHTKAPGARSPEPVLDARGQNSPNIGHASRFRPLERMNKSGEFRIHKHRS